MRSSNQNPSCSESLLSYVQIAYLWQVLQEPPSKGRTMEWSSSSFNQLRKNHEDFNDIMSRYSFQWLFRNRE
ncbi:MAG: hypothetical protein ACRC2R_16440 [Xenococcaceae cyanobacterium]